MKKKKMIFWILLVLFFGIFFIREQLMLNQLGRVQKENLNQLNLVKEQNTQLLNEVKLSKRSDFIEAQAREKLGLVKPGDIIFIDKSKKDSQ